MSRSITIAKAELHPDSLGWLVASERVKQQYWTLLAKAAIEVKDEELAQGLDRHGQPLYPISERTRRNRRSAMGPPDPNAPPLMPAYELSRTRSLLRARVVKDAILLYWANDVHTGGSWGKILEYHARGHKLPKRDVIGLSPDSMRQLRTIALRLWRVLAARGVPTERMERQKEVAILAARPTALPYRPAAGRHAVPVQARHLDILQARPGGRVVFATGFRQFRQPAAGGGQPARIAAAP